MSGLRVLVVDDSETVRRRIAEALASDGDMELVGEAEDGQQAIELCRRTRPDVVTMDMMMPIMSGLSATEYIMAHQPTPILIVSASFNRGELFKVYDALAAGAVDVLEKPTGELDDAEWDRQLISSVKLVSRIKVIRHPRASLEAQRASLSNMTSRASIAGQPFEIVAIGASTGGPGAIADVLRQLPAEFTVPVLIVLHMNEPFGSAFTDWLDAQTDRRVFTPQDGTPVVSARGRVAVAPCGKHLVVRGGRMFLSSEPERHSCRPSVDTLFDSVAVEYGRSAVACLLTGMGKDGAIGLLRIRQAGGVTIAQDEASSVVYGMPREAATLGAAIHILPLMEIGPRLVALQRCSLEAAS
jgi:two-component system, chemotaxis family, protein-glutamate methylesterase/glutaminase